MSSNGKVSIVRLAIVGITLLCLVLIVSFVLPIPVTIRGGHFLSIDINQKVSAAPDYPFEIVSERGRTTKLYAIGDGQYALDGSLESIHYQENSENPDDPWLEIDSTITNSSKPNWDWEVTKGHWHLLISNNTTVAVGKDGQWIGFRFDGVGYLDSLTKEYVVLFTRGAVTPTVQGNTIRWEGIVPGVNLEYVYGNDGFKEDIEITQQARTWLENHPPSSYGIPNNRAYLGAYFKCDWRNAYPAEDENGDPISWNTTYEFEDESIFFRHPIKDYIVSALPLGWARHDDLTPEDWVPVRERFYEQGGNHWLVLGSKVTDLNQIPSGTVIFDPTLDLSIGTSTDDAFEYSNGGVDTDNVYYNIDGSDEYAGFRWTGVDIPSGATIGTAYMSIYVSNEDDPGFYIHGQDANNPSTFSTDDYDISGRSKTTEYVEWNDTGIGPSQWQNSPSLTSVIQEVVDDNSGTGDALVIIWQGYTFLFPDLTYHTYDFSDHSHAPKIHIEYTTNGECSPSYIISPGSWNVNGGSPVSESSSYSTGLTAFNVTNNSSGGAIDITISAGNMTGGGYTWVLSNTAAPGDMIYGLKAGLSGESYNITVKQTVPYNTLVSNLADNSSQLFGLILYTPTNFDDGNSKSGGITLTVVCS